MTSTSGYLASVIALLAATLALPGPQPRTTDSHDVTASLPTTLSAVSDDIERIQHRQGSLKQRLRKLELSLLALERQFDVDGIEDSIKWPEPVLIAAQPRLSAASSLALQIDVPKEERPQPLAASGAITPDPVAPTTDPAVAISTEPVASAPLAMTPENEPAVIDVMDAPPGALNEALAVNDDALGEMRGGFSAPNGLEISFGIERAVYVNGALVTMTSLNLSDLGTPISNSGANSVSTALAQAGIGTAPTTSSGAAPTDTAAASTGTPITTATDAAAATATAAGGEAATALATTSGGSAVATAIATGGAATSDSVVASSPAATAQTVTNGATAISLPSGISVSDNSVALIQSGAGNTVQTAFDAAAIGTIVQNTLSNQKIQNVTVINATVNSLDILKSMNLQSLINSAITDSLNR